MVDYELHTLPNGIRLVHKQVTNTKIIHCGFILDIGSRDETPQTQGIAHFWEHMVFKGTRKRKAFHIINRLESVGGELNAYTTKEKICFYASTLDRYFEQAIELLADITFDSIFPLSQIEKERKVILEEMAMYHDDPDDAIQDDFDKVVFGGHPLGMNILGTASSVKSFSRNDFKQFITENINTGRIIFSSVGNIPFNKVLKQANKYLNTIPTYKAKRNRYPFLKAEPQSLEVKRNITQTLCAIGKTAYSIKDKNRLPFFMLINLLGGPGMNSRLNLALREKYGFVYSVDANYSPYIDTGLFGIFFGTEPKQLSKCIKLVDKELKKLREIPLGVMQLHNAKEQLMGQLAMAEENNVGLMLMMGKSLLDIDKINSLDEIFKQIKNIKSIDLQHIANEMFVSSEMSYLKFIPN
jgi:predicted Zn-dependent peptidase